MKVLQYIGARYIPKFADPIKWDKNKYYESLTVVLWQGNTYTSKQAVPAGVDIFNTEYWALTSNFNAQAEAYRKEVKALKEFYDQLEKRVEELEKKAVN